MKKGLIIAGASVLLLSGLVAGVFAKYQTNVDIAGGSVVAKSFAFTAVKDEAIAGTLKLAPGETVKIAAITATNFENTVVSEVNIDVKGTFNLSGDLVTGNSEVEYYFVYSGTTAEVKEISFALTAGAEVTKQFDIFVRWNDTVGTPTGDSSQNAFAGKTANWTLNLTGTQAA